MPSPRLHPSARTTRRQRRRIQASQDTDKACAQEMGLNVKTVAKWRRRNSVEDAPRGPKTPPRRALIDEDEVLAVALRQLTWAPLDVLLPRLQRVLPDLSRSALYRAWVRWGVSRTPRTANPPAFPFVRGEGKTLSDGEHFQLQVFLVAPQEKRALIFMVGEQSGWIEASVFARIENNIGYYFFKEALDNLRKTRATSMIEVTTPYNQMFCIEDTPDNRYHLFRAYCHRNNIVHKIATSAPTPVGYLQKGWPGVDVGRRTPRRRKSAPPQASPLR